VDGSFLLLGIILGFSIAAPIGPIGILCIRRTLACGWRSGLATGLGAATADGIYAVIAAFGLTVISGLLVGHLIVVRAAGGAFLVYLGVRTILSGPSEDSGTAGKGTLLEDYATTVFLTLTNPMTILSFSGIFAALGVGGPKGDTGSAVLMIAGIVAGSFLWWIVLVTGTSVSGSRCDTRAMGWVNKIAGALIFLFGILTFATIFL